MAVTAALSRRPLCDRKHHDSAFRADRTLIDVSARCYAADMSLRHDPVLLYLSVLAAGVVFLAVTLLTHPVPLWLAAAVFFIGLFVAGFGVVLDRVRRSHRHAQQHSGATPE